MKRDDQIIHCLYCIIDVTRLYAGSKISNFLTMGLRTLKTGQEERDSETSVLCIVREPQEST